MDRATNKTPLKLTSLKEQREIIRSSSNRGRMNLSPILEFSKNNQSPKINSQNLTPVLSRTRKIDSPRLFHEKNESSNLQSIILKANAAKETLEIKEKTKNSGLLYKKDNGERALKSGQAHRAQYGQEETKSPENNKPKLDFIFTDDTKSRKLSKIEAASLISRLQGTFSAHKK